MCRVTNGVRFSTLAVLSAGLQEGAEHCWKRWQVREVMRATLHRLLDTAGKARAAMLSEVCINTLTDIRLDVVKVMPGLQLGLLRQCWAYLVNTLQSNP